MLWTIFVVLLVLWLLAFSLHIAGAPFTFCWSWPSSSCSSICSAAAGGLVMPVHSRADRVAETCSLRKVFCACPGGDLRRRAYAKGTDPTLNKARGNAHSAEF